MSPMRQTAVDLLARALAMPGSRRQALAVAGALIIGAEPSTARRRRDSEQRGSTRGTAFSRKCRRFVISAGPNRNEKFDNIDDDLFIAIIPRNGGAAKTVFNDDNNAPNGPNGDHLSVPPFTARVGDQVHIVARNEVAGGCELDEIWLHCVEGRGGKVKLTDSITPAECQSDANRMGVFFETTVRIKNK
jgi:hypothetical protein